MKVLENVHLIVPFLTDNEIISISLPWALLFSIYFSLSLLVESNLFFCNTREPSEI